MSAKKPRNGYVYSGNLVWNLHISPDDVRKRIKAIKNASGEQSANKKITEKTSVPVSKNNDNSCVAVTDKNNKVSDESSDSSLDYGSANEDNSLRDELQSVASSNNNINTNNSENLSEGKPFSLIEGIGKDTVIKKKIYNELTETFESLDSSGMENVSANITINASCEIGEDPLNVNNIENKFIYVNTVRGSEEENFGLSLMSNDSFMLKISESSFSNSIDKLDDEDDHRGRESSVEIVTEDESIPELPYSHNNNSSTKVDLDSKSSKNDNHPINNSYLNEPSMSNYPTNNSINLIDEANNNKDFENKRRDSNASILIIHSEDDEIKDFVCDLRNENAKELEDKISIDQLNIVSTSNNCKAISINETNENLFMLGNKMMNEYKEDTNCNISNEIRLPLNNEPLEKIVDNNCDNIVSEMSINNMYMDNEKSTDFINSDVLESNKNINISNLNENCSIKNSTEENIKKENSNEENNENKSEENINQINCENMVPYFKSKNCTETTEIDYRSKVEYNHYQDNAEPMDCDDSFVVPISEQFSVEKESTRYISKPDSENQPIKSETVNSSNSGDLEPMDVSMEIPCDVSITKSCTDQCNDETKLNQNLDNCQSDGTFNLNNPQLNVDTLNHQDAVNNILRVNIVTNIIDINRNSIDLQKEEENKNLILQSSHFINEVILQASSILHNQSLDNSCHNSNVKEVIEENENKPTDDIDPICNNNNSDSIIKFECLPLNTTLNSLSNVEEENKSKICSDNNMEILNKNQTKLENKQNVNVIPHNLEEKNTDGHKNSNMNILNDCIVSNTLIDSCVQLENQLASNKTNPNEIPFGTNENQNMSVNADTNAENICTLENTSLEDNVISNNTKEFNITFTSNASGNSTTHLVEVLPLDKQNAEILSLDTEHSKSFTENINTSRNSTNSNSILIDSVVNSPDSLPTDSVNLNQNSIHKNEDKIENVANDDIAIQDNCPVSGITTDSTMKLDHSITLDRVSLDKDESNMKSLVNSYIATQMNDSVSSNVEVNSVTISEESFPSGIMNSDEVLTKDIETIDASPILDTTVDVVVPSIDKLSSNNVNADITFNVDESDIKTNDNNDVETFSDSPPSSTSSGSTIRLNSSFSEEKDNNSTTLSTLVEKQENKSEKSSTLKDEISESEKVKNLLQTCIRDKNREISTFDVDNMSLDEEIESTDELFKDSAAFDYLLNCGKTAVPSRHFDRESLFIKFDPLVQQLPTGKRPGRENVSEINETIDNCESDLNLTNSEQGEALSTMSAVEQSLGVQTQNTQPLIASVPAIPQNVSLQLAEKPTQVVSPAKSLRQQYQPCTPPQYSKTISVSPGLAAIDRLINLGFNTPPPPPPVVQPKEPEMDSQLLNELQSLKELFTSQEQELHQSKERVSHLEQQIVESNEREQALIERVNEKNRNHRQMSVVMEEYERTMSQLIGEREVEKRQWLEEKGVLVRERDDASAHLANIEHSFNDIHAKYERCKSVIQTYKANEELLKQTVVKHEENLKKQMERYEQLRQHAMTQLDKAGQELDTIRKSSQAEIVKYQAMLKKSEIQITSLQESLAQKTKNCEELTAICDELINKVG